MGGVCMGCHGSKIRYQTNISDGMRHAVGTKSSAFSTNISAEERERRRQVHLAAVEGRLKVEATRGGLKENQLKEIREKVQQEEQLMQSALFSNRSKRLEDIGCVDVI